MANSLVLSMTLVGMYVGVGAARALEHNTILRDTDWRDARVSDDPVLPSTTNLSACVALCRARPDCVAISWSGPQAAPADLNSCSPKCSALPTQMISKAGHIGVIVKPGITVCPQATWYPPEWQPDIDIGSMLLSGPKQEGGHVGNGYVAAWIKSLAGTAGPVQSGYEHVVGVFAGRNTNESVHSPHDPSSPNYGCVSWCDRAHKADLPSFTTTATIASIGGERDPNTASAMDLERAAYRRASANQDRTVKCVQSIFAHRDLKHILVTEFRCANNGEEAVEVVLTEPGPHPIAAPTAELSNSSEPSGIGGVHCSRMQVKWGETDLSPRAIVSECHTVCDQRTFQVRAGQEAFVACVSARHTSVDGLGAPTKENDWGSKLIPPDVNPTPLAIASWKAANATAESLFATHTAAMREVLRPGIEVEGDDQLAKVINSSVLSLLTTYRASERFGGSSSGGLCGDAYAGGTGGGWDLETWQLPWLLLFYPQMTHSLLQYRVDRMAAASVIAHTTVGPPTIDRNISWDGLRYPIMAALTGLDNDGVSSGNSGSPEHGYVTFPSEDHMTGDISLAAQQYFAASHNTTWLRKDGGFALIEGIARFWVSKAYPNPDGTWSIAQTQSPDEYHTNITDGVFPNAVAKQSLYGAYELAEAAGVTPNETFKRVADSLRILYCPAEGGPGCGGNEQRDFHPAFINGKSGTVFNTTCVPQPGSLSGQCQVLPDGGKIKQADVLLIYYPLATNAKPSTKKHDLDLYSQLTDIDGPAMTWMIHSIVYGDIGEDERAAEYFRKSWAGLVRSPFFVWHEGFNEFGGVPNFINGAGMFLVNIAAGYGGVRWNLTDGSLGLQRPRPPPNCTKLTLRRVFYRGAFLNIEARANGWTVALDEPAPLGVELQLRTHGVRPQRLTTTAVVRPAGSSATVVQLKQQD